MSDATIEVLLAEDNASDAELVRESLAGEELADRVCVVGDGEEALDILFERRPDRRDPQGPPRLIILDIKLPRVSGFDVLRAVRRDPRTRAIPVVMLTSSKMESDVSLSYALGANSYVQKPVDFQRFRETVRLLVHYWLAVNEPPPRRSRPAWPR